MQKIILFAIAMVLAMHGVAQNHSVRFSSNTDPSQCDVIRSMLDAVLGAPQDIDEITNEEMQKCENVKIIKDGQIYIIRGDKTYTLTGAELR